MDEEGAVGQEGFGVFDRAAGAEDGVLREESDPVSIRRFFKPVADQLRFIMQVDTDLAGTNRSQLFQNDLDQRFAEDRKERLGQMVRDRPEPLAETGRWEKNIDREFRHLKKLSHAETQSSQRKAK